MIDRTPRDPHGSPSDAAPSPDAKRRKFLLFGASAAGAAAAAPVLAAPGAIVETPAATENKSQGYRETAHVRRYYATTRL